VCENNNGWVIYLHDQYRIIIYYRGFESAYITDIPKTEKEAMELFEYHIIEDWRQSNRKKLEIE